MIGVTPSTERTPRRRERRSISTLVSHKKRKLYVKFAERRMCDELENAYFSSKKSAPNSWASYLLFFFLIVYRGARYMRVHRYLMYIIDTSWYFRRVNFYSEFTLRVYGNFPAHVCDRHLRSREKRGRACSSSRICADEDKQRTVVKINEVC